MMRSGWFPRGSVGGSVSDPSSLASRRTSGSSRVKDADEFFERGWAERELGRGLEDAVQRRCAIFPSRLAVVSSPPGPVGLGRLAPVAPSGSRPGPPRRGTEEDLALIGIDVGGALHLVDRLVTLDVGLDRELTLAAHNPQVVE